MTEHLTRDDWADAPAKQVVAHPVTSKGQAVSLVVLHHTVSRDQPFEDILRQVLHQHLAGEYYDFAYNGAASNSSDQNADGRGPLAQGGATGNGVDSYSLSIVAVGQFQPGAKDSNGNLLPYQAPSDKLVENVAQLIASWIERGYVAKNFALDPHRKYYATACCGDDLVARIPDIKARVNEIIAGGSIVVPDVNSPFGAVDVAEGDDRGVIRVAGWANDPDAGGPIDVHVYVDGQWGGGTFAGLSVPGDDGPSLNHRFDFLIGGTYEPGDHEIMVYGINKGSGRNELLEPPRTITVPPRAAPPVDQSYKEDAAKALAAVRAAQTELAQAEESLKKIV